MGVNIMKNKNSNNGSTILVVLSMVFVLTVLAASILQITSQTMLSGYRFVPFTQAMYTAEAGADYAWSEINRVTMLATTNTDPFSGTSASNWTKTVTGTGTVWTLNSTAMSSLFAGNEGASLYSVVVTTPKTAAPYTGTYTIESTGYVNAAPKLGQSAVSRKVKLYVEPDVSPVVSLVGLFGKIGVVQNGGSGVLTSYNSGSGVLANGNTGAYRFWGDMGSLASVTNAVTAGNLTIYGSIQTGPGGTVGTNANFTMVDGGGRDNSVTDTLVTTVPDVSLPAGFASFQTLIADGATVGATGGTNYYVMSASQLSNLIITGSGVVMIHLTKGIKISGGDDIEINPSYTIVTNSVTTTYTTNSFKVKGKTFTSFTTNTIVVGGTNYNNLVAEFYAADEMSLGGNGLVNNNGRPKNALFYGLPSCTSVNIAGGPKFFGVVYAPSADMTISGTTDFYGSAVAYKLTLNGGNFVAIDESLFGDPNALSTPAKYKLTKWEENY